MDASVSQKIQDILAGNDPIGIVVRENPNLDEMAGALSLYLSLSNMGKIVSVACLSEPIVEISSLVGINKVQKDLNTTGSDLIVSFPYKEGEIEKVSYTLENGYLNIVVKAGESGLSFEENEIKYKRGGKNPKVIFAVGIPKISDLENILGQELLKNVSVINIDNKSENQGFGDVVLVSPSFSSISEEVAYIISSLRWPMNADIAQNLLSGIIFATDNFQSQKTSAVAFEMSAVLMKNGAVRKTPAEFKGNRDFFAELEKSVKQQRQVKGFGNSFDQPEPLNQPKNDEEAPADWLTPKVYKGSSNIE